MHRLLRRQLKKLDPDSRMEQEWAPFLAAVDEAYHQYDTDLGLLGRSLDLSSFELLGANSELREGQSRQETQNQALLSLVSQASLPGAEVKRSVTPIIRTAADTLEVARCGVWVFNDKRTVIQCMLVHERSKNTETVGEQFWAREYPQYFEALQEGRTITIEDVRQDERTTQVTKDYLEPLGINSILDAPIWIGGKMAGVVCYEHTGPPRAWTLEEQGFAASVADLVGMAFQSGERRRAELALKESETRNRALLAAIPDVLFRVSKKGVVLDFQANTPQEGFGPQRDWVGKTLPQATPPEFAGPALAAIANCLKEMAAKAFEFQITPAEGPEYFFARAIPFHANEVLIMVEKITDRVQMEMHLRQAQKMETVGHLAGGVAHDFNNILQVISGNLELAMDKLRPEDALVGDLTRIADAARRAAELVAQLLVFSRKRPLNRADLNINEKVQGLMEMLKRLIRENIELVFDPEAEGNVINADPLFFDQVLLNLCLNARDAMPEGGRILIHTRNEHSEGQAGVLLSVTDTGTGIPAQHREKIFEPFFTTKEQGKGTGLGLAVAYAIVAQHQGKIEAEPGPNGVGTTLRVWVPLPAATHGEKAPLPQEVPHLVAPKATILVAEDEAWVRDLTIKILEGGGYSVLSASDGEEAIQILKKEGKSIDLVLLDVIMPKVGGRGVFDFLKTLSSPIPVVFCTGYAEEETQFIEENGFALLRKPYKTSALLLALQETLQPPASLGSKA